jgi:hypothetical protein
MYIRMWSIDDTKQGAIATMFCVIPAEAGIQKKGFEIGIFVM